jgi:hypothetical protein
MEKIGIIFQQKTTIAYFSLSLQKAGITVFGNDPNSHRWEPSQKP